MSKQKKKEVTFEEEEEPEEEEEQEEEEDEDEDEEEEEDEEDEEEEEEEEEESPAQQQLEETWLNPDYTYRILIASIQGSTSPILTKVANDLNHEIQLSCIYADEMRPASYIKKHGISVVQRLLEHSQTSHDLAHILYPSFENLEGFWGAFLEMQSKHVFETFPLQFENTYDQMYQLLEQNDHFASHEELIHQWQRREMQERQLRDEVKYYIQELERVTQLKEAAEAEAAEAEKRAAIASAIGEKKEQGEEGGEKEEEKKEEPPETKEPEEEKVSRSLLYFTAYLHSVLTPKEAGGSRT